jgi:mannose-6-phosphate isomerase class I
MHLERKPQQMPAGEIWAVATETGFSVNAV